MFFLAIVLKLRMHQSLPSRAHALHLLDPICWYANIVEREGISTEQPLMVTLLPSPPFQLHLRLVWRCDALALAQLTSWWTGLREDLSFQVGPYQGRLESVHLDDTPWAAVSTWADIMVQRPCSHLRLSFITPMIPRSSKDLSMTFPEPVPVFSRLHERWNALGGPQLPMTVEQLVSITCCVVSDYRVTMVAVQHAAPPLRGYDGWVEFEYRVREVEAITTLNMLARLAFYTGLGYYTERGMGAISVLQKG